MIARELRIKKAPFVKGSSIGRKCVSCKTDFMRIEGGSNKRGVWFGWNWYCSTECAHEAVT